MIDRRELQAAEGGIIRASDVNALESAVPVELWDGDSDNAQQSAGRNQPGAQHEARQALSVDLCKKDEKEN